MNLRTIFKRDSTDLEHKLTELSVEVEELREIVNELKQEIVEPPRTTPKKSKESSAQIIANIPNFILLAGDPTVTQKSVAEQYGLNQADISSYCRRNNIPWISKTPTKGRRNIIEIRIRQNFNTEKEFFEYCDTHYVREICETLQVSEDTIRRYLKKKGHKRPSKGEIRRIKESATTKKLPIPSDFGRWGIVKVLDSKGRAYFERVMQKNEFLTRERRLQKLSELTNYPVQQVEWYLQYRGIRY